MQFLEQEAAHSDHEANIREPEQPTTSDEDFIDDNSDQKAEDSSDSSLPGNQQALYNENGDFSPLRKKKKKKHRRKVFELSEEEEQEEVSPSPPRKKKKNKRRKVVQLSEEEQEEPIHSDHQSTYREQYEASMSESSEHEPQEEPTSPPRKKKVVELSKKEQEEESPSPERKKRRKRRLRCLSVETGPLLPSSARTMKFLCAVQEEGGPSCKILAQQADELVVFTNGTDVNQFEVESRGPNTAEGVIEFTEKYTWPFIGPDFKQLVKNQFN